jgi:hypothetical protein
MVWQICIRYPNGQERALRSCKDREAALRCVDAIYAQGYPMHVAYIVRPADPFDPFPADLSFPDWELV